mmetsp:Transcript_1994/g.4704  ORF Transcript_1994/g.4704 Transcript_1994/m.4704 type:complete len:102 (-) Transcript_1994:103-408(-)
MSGFVESFNISVAASIILYEAMSARRRLLGRSGDLDADQQRILRAVLSLRHQVNPPTAPAVAKEEKERAPGVYSSYLFLLKATVSKIGLGEYVSSLLSRTT